MVLKRVDEDGLERLKLVSKMVEDGLEEGC